MVDFHSNSWDPNSSSVLLCCFETDITGFVILWPWSYVQRHFTKAYIVSYGEEPAWRFVVVNCNKCFLSLNCSLERCISHNYPESTIILRLTRIEWPSSLYTYPVKDCAFLFARIEVCRSELFRRFTHGSKRVPILLRKRSRGLKLKLQIPVMQILVELLEQVGT